MCESCEWEEILESLNELCEDSDYEWANDTLAGIAENVEKWKHISEGQITAINNITAAVERRKR